MEYAPFRHWNTATLILIMLIVIVMAIGVDISISNYNNNVATIQRDTVNQTTTESNEKTDRVIVQLQGTIKSFESFRTNVNNNITNIQEDLQDIKEALNITTN